MKIAIDMHGGDHGLTVTVAALAQVVTSLAITPDVEFVLVGDKQQITQTLKQFPKIDLTRVTYIDASEQVEMHDNILTALRHKPNSSMRQAILAVKNGEADAAVSAGNTGALMALSQMLIKSCEGISRPALISALPTLQGHCYMLDLGANIDCPAEQLVEFALMGHTAVKVLDNLSDPTVALLNIGHEEIKGNAVVKQAHQQLQDYTLSLTSEHSRNFSYVGFVEGNDIFFDKANVIVCDGFVGNVALKTAEGVAQLVGQKLKAALSQSMVSKLASLPTLPYLKQMKQDLNPHSLNGAPLLGLKQTIVKSHGGATAEGFAHAIEVAVLCVHKQLPKKISEGIALINQSPDKLTP